MADREPEREEERIAVLPEDVDESDPNAMNAVFARNLLREDVGHHKLQNAAETFELDTETQARLLAHARQDAAHAALNTATLLEEIRLLKRLVAGAVAAATVAAALVIAQILKWL